MRAQSHATQTRGHEPRVLRRASTVTLSAALLSICAAPPAHAHDSTPYPDSTLPNGTAAYPWKIDRPEDFDDIGTDGTHEADEYYVLTQDLDFANEDHRLRVTFLGSFDGGYHTISGIHIDDGVADYVSLFNLLGNGSAIRRLAIVGSYFRGYNNVGAFSGSMGPGSLVEECTSQGNTVIAFGFQPAGGMVGGGSHTSPLAVLRNSFARDNSVSCPHQTVGGLSGYHDARIETSYSAGTTLTAPQYLGGIVGYGVSTAQIVDSYSDATNSPSAQCGSLPGGSWVNALVPYRYTTGFDITQYSILELNWDPAIWTIGADGYPCLAGFCLNEPPTAIAGPDQSIHAGESVDLDGSDSFDDATATANLLYSWSFVTVPAGSTGVLVDDDTATPSFVADLPGLYRVELVVTDEGALSSAPDEVEISSLNVAPTADAGLDQGVAVNTSAFLDGLGSSDPDLDSLTYAWTIGSQPAGSSAVLVDAGTATPSLTPDLEGDYVVELVVNDGFADSAPAEVTITAISATDFAKDKLREAFAYVRGLPLSSFDKRGHKAATLVYLRFVHWQLGIGHTEVATRFLNYVFLPRLDGCALRGAPDPKGWHKPDRPDWIVDCGAQTPLYDGLTAVLDALWP